MSLGNKTLTSKPKGNVLARVFANCLSPPTESEHSLQEGVTQIGPGSLPHQSGPFCDSRSWIQSGTTESIPHGGKTCPSMNDQQRPTAELRSRNKTMVQLQGYSVGPRNPWVRSGLHQACSESLDSLMVICC